MSVSRLAAGSCGASDPPSLGEMDTEAKRGKFPLPLGEGQGEGEREDPVQYINKREEVREGCA